MDNEQYKQLAKEYNELLRLAEKLQSQPNKRAQRNKIGKRLMEIEDQFPEIPPGFPVNPDWLV